MVASRLSDSQKAELVERFRRGASTQALAEAYGCSPNTVIRAAKAALEPALYEELKQKRSPPGQRQRAREPGAIPCSPARCRCAGAR
jgi:transposase-like protein